MKVRLLSIFLLFSIFIPGTATYLWMRNARRTLRREVKHQMMADAAKDQLVQLKFHQAEAEKVLRWKHSREFQFKREMFDVVHTEYRGDSVIYHCWWDHEETFLNQKLNEVLASLFNQAPQKQEREKSLQSFYKNLFVSIPSQSETSLVHTLSKPIEFYQFSEQSILIQVPSPPPKV